MPTDLDLSDDDLAGDNWRSIGECASDAIAQIGARVCRDRDAARLTVQRQRAELARLNARLEAASRTVRDLTTQHDCQKARADAAEARLRSCGLELA